MTGFFLYPAGMIIPRAKEASFKAAVLSRDETVDFK